MTKTETTITIETTPTGRIRKASADQAIAALAGRTSRIKRYVDDAEMRTLVDQLPAATSRVRVYSGAGFVPNSYRYACPMEALEATRDADTGNWVVRIVATDAKRSGGTGPTVVVR